MRVHFGSGRAQPFRLVLYRLALVRREVSVDPRHFAAVLAEMNDERHTLTRSLLGVDANSGEPPARRCAIAGGGR
jgi:hypothetical protein